MPRAPKACSHPTCPNVQPCPDHQRKLWQGSYRRAQLPSGWSSRIVPRILKRDPLCTLAIVCRGLALSTEVHHTGDPMDHRDEALGGTCHDCHATVTQQQAAAARRAA